MVCNDNGKGNSIGSRTILQRPYSSKINVSEEQLHQFSDNSAFPQLTNEECESLKGPLTKEECKKILATFNSDKSPGEDGFTAEFYSAFVDLIGADLVKSLNSGYAKVNCQSLKKDY